MTFFFTIDIYVLSRQNVASIIFFDKNKVIYILNKTKFHWDLYGLNNKLIFEYFLCFLASFLVSSQVQESFLV